MLVHGLFCVTAHLPFPLLGTVGVSRLYWGAVGVSRLYWGAVSVSRLYWGAVSVSRLYWGAVGVSRLYWGAVRVSQLYWEAVGVSRLYWGAVGVSRLYWEAVGMSRLYWGAVGAETPDWVVSPTDGRFIPIILPAHPTIIWNGQLLLDSIRERYACSLQSEHPSACIDYRKHFYPDQTLLIKDWYTSLFTQRR